jgi:hypothetical protein
MFGRSPLPLCWLGLFLLLVGCAPATPRAPAQSGAEPARRAAAPKRITVAMLGVLPAFWDDIAARGGVVPGTGQFKGLASGGLIVLDETNAVRAQLGEAVPSIENGLWKVLSDGRMELTWRIRDGARWHDGRMTASPSPQRTYCSVSTLRVTRISACSAVRLWT